jgi:hypothetical protein
MKNDNIDEIWNDIEAQNSDKGQTLQKMIYIDLLYRTYIGVMGIPSHRFLSLEIPEEDQCKFESVFVPQGFNLFIADMGIKHKGYSECILEASSSEQNDVFTIVTKDILNELRKNNNVITYVKTLQDRIKKWEDFFKKTESQLLTDKEVIGLFGELTLIKELKLKGLDSISDYWNGPIRAAQDFQSELLSIEVKTTSANKIEKVNISSEIQLDSKNGDTLYLVVYRIERNDVTGIRLPQIINEVENLLSESQKKRFDAKLNCLGYSNQDEIKYTKGYFVRERKIYLVDEDFPRITPDNLAKDISDVKYKLSLNNCDSFLINMMDIIDKVEEN